MGTGRKPFEDFPSYLQGEEAGGCDGVDLGGHVEFVVYDDPKILGMGGRGRRGSQFSRPPCGFPW